MKRNRYLSACVFVMEATGVYFEDLAYYLHEHAAQVCIELAGKVKHYAKSLSIKTKTDKVDAQLLSELGLERCLRVWQPLSPLYRELRDTNRLLLAYKKNLSRLKSQLHAMAHAHGKSAVLLDIHREQMAF